VGGAKVKAIGVVNCIKASVQGKASRVAAVQCLRQLHYLLERVRLVLAVQDDSSALNHNCTHSLATGHPQCKQAMRDAA
jgi:hypothetical protein